MLAPCSLQSIDQLLNELEELAHSQMPAVQFLTVLCERLVYLSGGQGAVVLLPVDPTWQSAISLAHGGAVSSSHIDQVKAKLQNANAGEVTTIAENSTHGFLCAAPLRGQHWSKGLILLTLAEPPAGEARHSLSELLTAFAEIASLKQLLEVEQFLDSRWQSLQEALAHIATSGALADAAMALVNHGRSILVADRITLAQPSLLKGLEVTAISGVSDIDPHTDTVRALRQIAKEAQNKKQAVVRHANATPETTTSKVDSVDATAVKSESLLDENGLFPNLIAVRLNNLKNPSSSAGVLIVEWSNYPKMVSAVPVLNQVQPLLSQAWEQQRRWLKIPVWGRALFGWDARLPAASLRIVRWAIIGLACLLVYRVLMISYPLTIEAPAFLEPEIKRAVFATADGYVDALLVEDGQKVEAGKVVAKLRSPSLELQMEELRGQLRTLAERRSSVRIAINQIDASTKDALTQQSRLSAEITQINTQEANIQKQLKLLGDERQKLDLVAPIGGVVVARDMKQQLLQRPVRRGDSLFVIVDLEGPWHLRIEVADRDTGYVRSQLKLSDQGQSGTGNKNNVNTSTGQSGTDQAGTAQSGTDQLDSAGSSGEVEFILDSLPEQRFTADVNWLSDTVQNRPGEGCYWEVHAKVQQSIVDQSHMGAGALAYFRCGQAPLWFVWCRPLVESAQRKFWILNEGSFNDAAVK